MTTYKVLNRDKIYMVEAPSINHIIYTWARVNKLTGVIQVFKNDKLVGRGIV